MKAIIEQLKLTGRGIAFKVMENFIEQDFEEPRIIDQTESLGWIAFCYPQAQMAIDQTETELDKTISEEAVQNLLMFEEAGYSGEEWAEKPYVVVYLVNDGWTYCHYWGYEHLYKQQPTLQ